MDHDHSAEDLFQRAADLPDDERAEFLARECKGDPDLRTQVEDLLLHLNAEFPVAPIQASELEAPFAGPYRLLEQIGEGGFGEVYLAEQQSPVRRQVAVKILKAGMDSKAVLARFEAERQALALMEHPNIAKVLDAGETDRGLPYFVMELVKGDSLTTYCDRDRLSMSERLRLFIPICQAVHHAHQKGIIHRDLKPSNILVSIVDGEPVPKVIDFGIAKAVTAHLTDKTIHTLHDQLIGTPNYMSPEQAERSGIDVDTTTDVYSLGVILYELLTGALPIDVSSAATGGPDELMRVIREKDPPKPSQRLKTPSAETTQSAKNRGSEPKILAKKLRGDLDWVVMRAMEKNRTRRYQSASELSLEILRVLDNEPVLAGPPSALYRFGKFARRNNVAIVVAGALLFGVLAALAGLSVALESSNRERVRVQGALQETERARAEGEAVTDFLTDMFMDINPAKTGRETKLVDALEYGATKVETEFADRPLVQARLFATIGLSYHELGEYQKARPFLERALRLRETHLDESSHDVIVSLESLALLYAQVLEKERARELYDRVLRLRTEAHGPGSPEALSTMANYANTLEEIGDRGRARELYLAIAASEAEDIERKIGAFNGLAILEQRDGNIELSRRYYEQSLELIEQRWGTEGPNYLQVLSNMASLSSASGDLRGAAALYERTLIGTQNQLGERHLETARIMTNLGDVRRKLGEYDIALELLSTAREIRIARLGPNHPALATSELNLGLLYSALEEWSRARPHLEKALEIDRRRRGSSHPHVLEDMEALAVALNGLGELDAARQLEEEVRAIRELGGVQE